MAGPEWVELELDIATRIPRFGKTKRLVSITAMDRPLGQLEELYDKAVAAKADDVKITTPTLTLESA